MLRTRLALVTAFGMGLALLLGSRLWAGEDHRSEPPRQGQGPRQVEDQPQPPPAVPEDDEFAQPRPGGFLPGRGPRLPGGHPATPMGPPAPGMAPEGMPGAPGRPGLTPGDRIPMGPGGPGGPGGPLHWPHFDWEALEKYDPEMHKLLKEEQVLDQRSREMAVQYRLAPADQRPAIKEKLKTAVNAHFEVRQQRRQLELKRLEEELKRLRDAISQRNASREAIVDKRVLELLGEDRLDF